MKDYSTFEAADFARDPDFLNWVRDPDKEQDRYWTTWVELHPEKRDDVLEARRIIEAVIHERQHYPTPSQKSELRDRIETAIGPAEEFEPIDESPSHHWPLRIAAAIAFLVLCGTAVWHFHSSQTTSSDAPLSADGKVETVNNGTSPLHIALGDGSAVTLAPNSVITYPTTFDGTQREVYLKGSAFFEIQKDPQRPFLVYTKEVVTKVLGTSFNIRAYDNEPDVTVGVRTGRVSVFTQEDVKADADTKINGTPQGVVLTPNQQAVYSRVDSKFVKSLVESPAILSPSGTTNKFEFTDAPMKEVFSALEEAYGIEIVFDEDVMANCYLNADLTDESLDDKLALVCKTINAHYEVMDAHIIIYGQGCKK